MKNITVHCIILLVLFNARKLTAQPVAIPSVKISAVTAQMNQADDTLRVINLWATWCAPCVKELPYFEQAYQRTRGQRVRFMLLAIEDDLPKVIALRERKKITAPVWFLDETDANTWAHKIKPGWDGVIPVTLFVRRGEVLHFQIGEMSAAELDEKISQYQKQ